MNLDGRTYLIITTSLLVFLAVAIGFAYRQSDPLHVVELSEEPPQSVVVVDIPETPVSTPAPATITPVSISLRTAIPEFEFRDEDIQIFSFDGMEDGTFLETLRTYYPANIDSLIDETMLEDLEKSILSYHGWLFTRDLEYHAEQHRRNFGETDPATSVETSPEDSEKMFRLLLPAAVERMYVLVDPIQVRLGGLEHMVVGPTQFRPNPHLLKSMLKALRDGGRDPNQTIIANTQVLVKTQDGDYHWSQLLLTWSQERQHFLTFSQRTTRLLHPESDILTIKSGRPD